MKRDRKSSDDPTHYDSTWDAMVKIAKDEGILGLYAGMTGCLIGVASTNFAYFYWYSLVRGLYLSRASSSPSTVVELSIGAVAGALAQLFTIPVAVITTRQQTMPKGERKGLFGTAKEIVESEDGWSGLWRGLKASLVLVINPSITYGAYQRLRTVMFKDKPNLRPAESFLLGALSKSMATLATQPLIVAKVGLQSRPPPKRNGKPFKSFGEVMAFIVEHEGMLSLFKGIGPQILKGLLVQGFLMMTKERYVFTSTFWEILTNGGIESRLCSSYSSVMFVCFVLSNCRNSQQQQQKRLAKCDQLLRSKPLQFRFLISLVACRMDCCISSVCMR
jgi:hypothetical protein